MLLVQCFMQCSSWMKFRWSWFPLILLCMPFNIFFKKNIWDRNLILEVFLFPVSGRSRGDVGVGGVVKRKLFSEMLVSSYVDLTLMMTLRWLAMRQAWWLDVEGYMLMHMTIILIQFQTTGYSFSFMVVWNFYLHLVLVGLLF